MKTKAILALSLITLAATGIPAFGAEPDKGAALADAVKKAIASKDAAALEKLVYWEGATEGGKDFFKGLLEVSMEIKVQNVEVIPLPPGKTGPRTTLPVTHLLKITGTEGEGPSRQMYPVGEKDGRMYLACAVEAPGGMK
jgi:hypothetical protein